MSIRKKIKLQSDLSDQRNRTHKNKIKKYRNLITKFPESSMRHVWEKKLEYSRKKISGN